MDIMSIHKKALSDRVLIVNHEFKLRYERKSNKIYAFVEGKDDPSFYKGMIDNRIPYNWRSEIWQMEGKDNVIKMYRKINWSECINEQVLFFIDRDLSHFIEEDNEEGKNIYITDDYSIENNFINYSLCDRALRELWGFTNLEYSVSDELEIRFFNELNTFKDNCVPIMASIIYWRRNGFKPCCNDIFMKHLFKFESGILTELENPKRQDDLHGYLSSQCSLCCLDDDLIKEIKEEFIQKEGKKRFIRGKYLIWFMYNFCESLYRDYFNIDLLKNISAPKKSISMSEKTFLILLAPRMKLPRSLEQFFSNTIDIYIQKLEVA